jgi:hypothetical protein
MKSYCESAPAGQFRHFREQRWAAEFPPGVRLRYSNGSNMPTEHNSSRTSRFAMLLAVLLSAALRRCMRSFRALLFRSIHATKKATQVSRQCGDDYGRSLDRQAVSGQDLFVFPSGSPTRSLGCTLGGVPKLG